MLESNTTTNPIARDELSVLVLGEDTRSFLSVIRSFGRAGYKVHVVCYNRKSPALRSKYISASFYYNYQSFDSGDWLSSVLALVSRYQYNLIFPCDERAIYPLWHAKAALPSHTQLAIANQEALVALFDKWKTKQIALKCHVPVAAGELIQIQTDSYDQLVQQFGSPFVLKPLQSFEMSSLEKRNQVVIVKSEADYLAFSEVNKDSGEYLIEAYFEGQGEGVSVFSWDGQVKMAFAYRRLAEPDSGGGSSYRQSIPLDPEQLTGVEAICREAKLSGLAMFEFRRNTQTGEWILVEVNARVWGGLPLAEYADIDFPQMYANHLLGLADNTDYSHSPRVVSARALTADLYEIKREFEKIANAEGRLSASGHMAVRLANIGRVLSTKESIDSLRLDDAKPFFAEVGAFTGNVFMSLLKQQTFLIKLQRMRTKKRFTAALQSNPHRRLVFICYGNIIRSPFAERYVHDHMDQKGVHVELDSFGFHHKEGRSSPDIAITAAQQLNCDLTQHQSKCLTQYDLQETDIVIYFDEKNRAMLEASYRVNHAFCAADFLENSYPELDEISDPYESDVETIRRCYDKVKVALDNLMSLHRRALQ